MNEAILLFCTVGGSPEPVVAALARWRPSRVYFVDTPETAHVIETRVVPMAREQGVDLGLGSYDRFTVADSQNIASCVNRLRELTPIARNWIERSEPYRVVVDFTGGTKCMSAAIAVHASRWRSCLFSYVGGSQRSKDGVGIVESGTEEVFSSANPWDDLGYDEVESFAVLFNQHAFAAAAGVAHEAKKQVSDQSRKREFAVLEHLAQAFDAWDRFDPSSALEKLRSVEKSANDLRGVLGPNLGAEVLDNVAKLTRHLAELHSTAKPSRHHVLDLLANAKRRRQEGRFDDAVVRLYRAIEAMAQVALKERHGIDSTDKVLLDRVPEPLRNEWANRTKDGVVRLGLQDAYLLLASLNDELAQTFESAGVGGTQSPLVARNGSMLGHGFERISKRAFDALWSASLSLAGIDGESLPSSITLRTKWDR